MSRVVHPSRHPELVKPFQELPRASACDAHGDVEYDKLSSTRARWSHSVDTLPQR